MVNGATSRLIYLGAFIILGICLIGLVVMAVLQVSAPSIFDAVIVGLLGFIVGAHIKPPVSTDGNGSPLLPSQLTAGASPAEQAAAHGASK